MSDISLPDLYVDPNLESKDKTPHSSRVAEASRTRNLQPQTIDLDSPPVPTVEVPVPALLDEERNRNITNIMEDTEVPTESPIVGSRV